MQTFMASDSVELKKKMIESKILPEYIEVEAGDVVEKFQLVVTADQRVSAWLKLYKNSPHRHVTRFNIFAISENLTSFAEELGAAYTMRENVFQAEAQLISDKLALQLAKDGQDARGRLDAIEAEAAWKQSGQGGDFSHEDVERLTNLAQWATNMRLTYAQTKGHPLNFEDRLCDAEVMYRFTLALMLARGEAIRRGLSRNYGIVVEPLIDESWLDKNPFPKLREWMRNAGLQLSESTRREVRFTSFRLLGSNGIWDQLDENLRKPGALTYKFDLGSFLPVGFDWSKWKLRLLGVNACLVSKHNYDANWLQNTANANSLWVITEARAARQSWSSDLRITLPSISLGLDAPSLGSHDVFLNGTGVFGAGTNALEAFIRPISLGAHEGRPLPESIEIWVGDEIRFVNGTTNRAGLLLSTNRPAGGGGPAEVYETLISDVAVSISIAAVPIPVEPAVEV